MTRTRERTARATICSRRFVSSPKYGSTYCKTRRRRRHDDGGGGERLGIAVFYITPQPTSAYKTLSLPRVAPRPRRLAPKKQPFPLDPFALFTNQRFSSLLHTLIPDPKTFLPLDPLSAIPTHLTFESIPNGAVLNSTITLLRGFGYTNKNARTQAELLIIKRDRKSVV